MNKYSSTLMKIFSQNCPHSLGLHEKNTPADNDFHQTGIAAHAVLEVIAQKKATSPRDQQTVANAVCKELITHGRSFAGYPEPPINPDHAFEGRELALNWLSWNEIPDGAIAEGGYGITKQGKPCAYDADDCRFNAVIDLIYFRDSGDEDYQFTSCVVRDYKSAWPTDESELDTVQRRGQAVVAWRKYGDKVDAITMEVVNLRTGKVFERSIMLNDEGIMELAQWENDILMTCDAMDATREARPGAGCMSCKHTLACEHCLTYYIDNGTDAAVSYATTKAVSDQLGKVLRERSRERKFHINAGYVGYREMQKKVLTEDALKVVSDHWCAGEDEQVASYTRGLLRAADVTPTSIEKIAAVIYPDKKSKTRKEFIDGAIRKVTDKRFGVHKG